MEHLKEILSVLQGHKHKTEKVLDLMPDRKGLLPRYYDGLLSGHFQSDEDAANELLDTSPSHYSFRRLKRKMQEALQKSLFFIDFKAGHYSAIQRAFYDCHIKWAAARILGGRGARRSAVQLSREVLHKARKYQLNHLVLTLLPYLINQYGTQFGDEKMVKIYSDMAEKYLGYLRTELESTRRYNQITQKFVDKVEVQEEVTQEARAYCQDMEQYVNKIPSYHFHQQFFNLSIWQWMNIGDYRKALKECQRAIRHFENLPFNHKTARAGYYLNAVLCLIQLQQHEEAEKNIKKALTLIASGSSRWMRLQEASLILKFHRGDYQDALEVFQRVERNAAFTRLAARHQERWRLYHAFLTYLEAIGQIHFPSGKQKKFRLQKFLNDMPTYSHDKRGLNIPILIIQSLFLVQQGQYSKVEKRLDALQRYTSRYLLKNDTYRSNCFIKMLLTASRRGFHRTATVRHTEKYRKKLGEVPLPEARQASEIEIIPYEELWELFLGTLDNKIH